MNDQFQAQSLFAVDTSLLMHKYVIHVRLKSGMWIPRWADSGKAFKLSKKDLGLTGILGWLGSRYIPTYLRHHVCKKNSLTGGKKEEIA